jgi:hypothetical protein
LSRLYHLLHPPAVFCKCAVRVRREAPFPFVIGTLPRNDQKLGDDLICGVAAIATEIGESPRRTQHLCDKRDIPVFKMRGRLYARRSSLRQHFEELERHALVHGSAQK